MTTATPTAPATDLPRTLSALMKSGWRSRSVKEELRGKSVAGAVGVAVVIGVVLVFMFNGSNTMRELEIHFGS